MKRHIRISALILTVLAALLLFSACRALTPSLEGKQQVLDQFMQQVIAKDKDAAFDAIGYTGGAEQTAMDAFWDELLRIYDGAESYKIEFVSWNTTYSAGKQVTTVQYKVSADNDGTGQFSLTFDGQDNMTGIYITDVTVQKGPLILCAQIALFIWSILSLAFAIWMIVDCIKRPIRLKVLWILVICVSFVLTLTVAGASFNTNFNIGWLFSFASLNVTASYFTLRLTLPLGALLYFFVRKKLKLKPDKNAPIPQEEITAVIEDQPESAAAEQMANDAESDQTNDQPDEKTDEKTDI